MPRPWDTVTPSEACLECPLCTKDPAPILPRTARNPQCVIVCEHPGPQEAWSKEPLSSVPARKAVKALAREGITRVSCIYRIGCFPNTPAKRTDSALTKAAKACKARFLKQWGAVNPGEELPTLWWGKHSHAGILGTHSWTLKSGATSRIPHHKLAKNMPFQQHMVMDHPRVPFWYKCANVVPWLTAVKRWAAYLRKEDWGAPPIPLTEPGEDALQAIRSLGPIIATDVETLGVDPTRDPVTCIGLADVNKAISVPWDPYAPEPGGLAAYPLGARIRQAIIDVLGSARLQVTQNGAYDVCAFEAMGIPGRNDFDIMHAQKICWPEIAANLEAIGVQHVQRLDHRWKTVFRAGSDDDAKGANVFQSAHKTDLRHYNGLDAWTTVAAYEPLDTTLDTEDDPKEYLIHV